METNIVVREIIKTIWVTCVTKNSRIQHKQLLAIYRVLFYYFIFFKRNCPKFHIFTKNLIVQVKLEFFRLKLQLLLYKFHESSQFCKMWAVKRNHFRIHPIYPGFIIRITVHFYGVFNKFINVDFFLLYQEVKRWSTYSVALNGNLEIKLYIILSAPQS